MASLLDTPFFSCRGADGLRQVSLPGLYAVAMADGILDMPAVRPHQRQALHAFLAQVGALALIRAGLDIVPGAEAEWTTLLKGLTPEYPDDSPWSLVVEDLSRPALLQPPVPEGTLDVLKEREETPDAIDMLVTSKDHDVKAARMAHATPEHWFLALLTRQTIDGYLGRNFGISRMYTGTGSRPMVGLAPAGGWGARLRRDIQRLVDLRHERTEPDGYAASGGIGLVWLVPWDGVKAISVNDLDPYYVEVCRRIRLTEVDGRIVARRVRSEAPRIAFPKEANGVTGDPWAPVDVSKPPGKCLTIDGSGFSYHHVLNLVGAGATRSFEPAPLQCWCPEDGESGVELVMVVTARGEGGTNGFHERRIMLPAGVPRLLATDPDPLATLARQRVQDAATTQRQVLKPALYTLFQNGPEQVDFRHTPSERKAEPFLAAFDRAVDRRFFDDLFAEFSVTEALAKAEVRRRWLSNLLQLCQEQLDLADAATARSGLRRYGAVGAARNALDSAFHFRFPDVPRSPS